MDESRDLRIRLVTFLGISNYQHTSYRWQEQTCTTEYVAEALAQLLPADDVIVLGTTQAWDKHGAEIERRLNRFGVKRPNDGECFPIGENATEFWQQFEQIKQVLRASPDVKIVLDITHGFRSQPFFASAAITFVRALDLNPRRFQVVYGAYEQKNAENISPIWDITPFIELVDWSHRLMMFLKTGRVSDVAETTKVLGKQLLKQWHQSGREGKKPFLDRLGTAMNRFGESLETVRTGDLLLGTQEKTSSAVEVASAIQHCREQLVETIPPLADVLDRIESLVQRLITNDRLSQPDGQRALRELGSVYWEMGRYAEAAATMREAWITQHACSKADCPGQEFFSSHHREAAEKAWFEANTFLAKEIGEIRNDIQHAGYRSQPIPPATIKRKIKELLDRIIPDQLAGDSEKENE